MYFSSKNQFFKAIAIAICFSTATQILPANKSAQYQNQDHAPATYLFSHGYGGTGEQAIYYSEAYAPQNNNRCVIGLQNNKIKTFDYPDCKYFITDPDSIRPTDLGQTEDINALKAAYDEIINENPQARVVMQGPSRGAVTQVNFVGEHNPENIAALVLESPFDHGHSVAKQFARNFWLTYMPFSAAIIHKIMARMLVNYKTNGQQPINSVAKIKNKQLPILIVCSKQDTLIPWTSSKRLYEKFIAEGFVNCELVVVDHGPHANILNGPDGQKYHDAVQAFYKKHHLPYIK